MKLFLACSLALLALEATAQTPTNQSVPAPPAPNVLKLETGFGYSSGDYGLNTDTEVIFAPVALVYDTPQYQLRASVPWLSIKGPAVALAATGLLRPTAERESGLGDVQLSGSYKLLHQPDQPTVNFTGKVKLPTADDLKGLGTGGTDYTAQVDVLQSFGRITPFGAVGYRWMGDHGIYHLENGWSLSAGAAWRIMEGSSVGASYEWRQTISRGGADSSELSVFYFKKLNAKWAFNLYGLRGFSDASPNLAVGGTVIYSF